MKTIMVSAEQAKLSFRGKGLTARRRLPSLLVALLVVLLGTLGSPAIAHADEEVVNCQASGGIYVYVLNEGEQLAAGCTSAGTASARINEIASANQTSKGFICQINSIPDKCKVNSRTKIYWSFWWWQDDAWNYATTGGSYAGDSGTVEAWNYSKGEAPTFNPIDASAPAPANPIPEDQQFDDGQGTPIATVSTFGVIIVAAAGYGLWRRRKGKATEAVTGRQ